MEEQRQIDLTYITERIITLSCPPGCPEEAYLQSLQHIVPMLQSKHRHNYMIINLSQKHAALAAMNHKILNTGWVDLLAPSLDHIINVCTMMEKWLLSDQKHVLVLHCRGGNSLLGVLLASYIHFSNTSASADLSLDHFAMRRFYNDKLATLMTPSQKRYVWMLGSMLKGGLRMRPSPSFLLCVVLHGLPKVRPDGGCSLFLRVYQSLQAVCTSAVHHVTPSQTDRLYFVLQPAQLLKGDIMVICYDKSSGSATRQVIFRLQFHTGLVVGHSLTFYKADLDCASEDSRFLEDGKVELLLSESPEKFEGRELWLNGVDITVDYDTLDPRVRRDSFQDSSRLDAGFPHIEEPGDGSVFAEVKKKSSEEGCLFTLPAGTASLSDRTPSASSDSGLSVASQGRTAARQSRRVTQDKGGQAGRLVTGPNVQIIQPLLEVMTELAARGGRGLENTTGDESGLGHAINGELSSSERETDILEDDEDDGRDVASLGREIPSSSSVCSLSSETQIAAQTQYSTHAWVQQQQIEDVDIDKVERPPLISSDTPPHGLSSRDGVQRALVLESTDIKHGEPRPTNPPQTSQDDEMESLTTDIDESIEQLNQLILDLDPTFVPVPTRCSPLSRSASLHTNGLSHKGNAHLSGWKQQKQITDVTDYASLHSPGWTGGGSQGFRGSVDCSPSFSSTPLRDLYKTNSVAFRGQTDAPDVPSTPAFPVSPPTPYVKSFSELLQHRTGRQWDHHGWTQGTLRQDRVCVCAVTVLEDRVEGFAGMSPKSFAAIGRRCGHGLSLSLLTT